jgi:hypothetical protein
MRSVSIGVELTELPAQLDAVKVALVSPMRAHPCFGTWRTPLASIFHGTPVLGRGCAPAVVVV